MHRINCCLLLILSTILGYQLLDLPARCQDKSSYQHATELYKQKKYIEAATHFMHAWKLAPNNASAAYYGAYCLYLGGRKDSSVKAFWLVVDKFPQEKEGKQARKILQRIDPEYGKKAKTSSQGADDSQSDKLEKRLSSKELVDKMIVVHKPRGKIPAVSSDFISGVRDLLVEMPRYVLLMMRDRKARIHIVPALVETDYRMLNVRPRGYDQGSSWQNSTAMCRGRNLYIAQHRLDKYTGAYVTANTEIGSIRHEAGHCIDYCLGYVSQKDRFRHPYRLDAARVPAADRHRLRYFLQTDRGGPSETFAELCCHRFGGDTSEWGNKTCNMIKKYFKGPDAVLGAYLKQIEKKYEGM